MRMAQRGIGIVWRILKWLCHGVNRGVRDAIFWLKTFKEHPLRSFSIACAYATCVIAMLTFIVMFAVFVAVGGYPAQIEAIKTFGIDSVESAFTSGTVPFFYRSAVGGTMLFFLSLSVVFMLIEYFVASPVVKKIVMAVDLLLLATFSTAFTMLALHVGSLGLKGSEGFALWLEKVERLLHVTSVEQIMLILIAAVAVTVIILMVLSDKKILSKILISGIFSFGILPLMLLLVENVLALAYVILFGICFCFVLMFIGMAISGSGAPEGAASAESHQKPAEKLKKMKTEDINVINIAANQKIYIDEGNGLGAPLTQCVFTDTAVMNHKFLCTVADFKCGKVKIVRGGKEISASFVR